MEQVKLGKREFLELADRRSKFEWLRLVGCEYLTVTSLPHRLCIVDTAAEYYYEGTPEELWEMVLRLTALSDTIHIR